MAAACNVAAEESQTAINNDLLEAQIVAQAITELQEIQGPMVQHTSNGQTTDFVNVITESGATGESGDTQDFNHTQVIYYIEDGTVSRTLDRTLVDSSVQANDYEIERRSGRVPSRKRVIPIKFRDYKHNSDENTSDSDYDPNESSPRPRKTPRTTKPSGKVQATSRVVQADGTVKVLKAGRPRKNFMPTHTAKGDAICMPSVEVSSEIERKYQEALRISRETAGTQVEEEGGDEAGNQQGVVEDSGHDEEPVISREQMKEEPDDDTGNAEKEDGSESPGQSVPVKRGRGRPRAAGWERFYKCPDCGKTFNQKGNLRVHLRVHTSDRPFPCQEDGCDKSFRSNESLRRHLLSHQGIKPFSCELCGNKFSSNVALIEHRSRHYDQKPYECPHCNRRFRQVSCLRRHVMTHSDDLPYYCEVCQRRFAQSSYLKSHMKVHTGEKPFQCDQCDKRFAHQSDVKRHRTTHTGEKPYACSKCQTRFSDVSSKNRHEKEHENVKRYTCHLCSDTFKRTGQLRSHLTRKHTHTFPVKIEKATDSNGFTFRVGEEGEPGTVHLTQHKLVSLIKNLHNKTVSTSEGFADIGNISVMHLPDTENQSEVTMSAEHVTDISQLEKEVDASVIESDMGVPIELQGVEIQGEEAGQTFIAIADLADSLSAASEKGGDEKRVEHRYRIVCEISEDGEQKQLLVPYDVAEDLSNLDVHVQYSSMEGEPGIDTVDTESSTVISHTTPGEHIVMMAEQQQQQQQVNETSETDQQIAEQQMPETNQQTVDIQQQTTEVNQRTAEEQLQTEIISAAETIIHDAPVQDGADTGDNAETETLHSESLETSDAHAHEMEENLGEVAGTEADKQQSSYAVNVDYVVNPDFSSQDYYNWLTNFTELCKVVPMPLDVSLFQKISQVHKTLSDVMATPSGVIADRENFRVLMNISRELSTIINEHLVYVLDNLNPEDRGKETAGNMEITNL